MKTVSESEQVFRLKFETPDEQQPDDPIRAKFRQRLYGNPIIKACFDAWMRGRYPSLEVALLDMVTRLDEHNERLIQKVMHLTINNPAPVVIEKDGGA